MKNQSHHTTVLLVLLVIATAQTGISQVPESLKKIEDQYLAAFQIHVEEAHQSQFAELNARYVAALEKAFQTASKGDRLEEALALKEEMKRIQEKEPLPQEVEGVLPVLLRLRSTYRGQFAKLEADREKAAAPIVKKFGEALAAHQSALTKAGAVEEAAAVKAYREAGVAAKLLGEGAGVAESSAPPEKPTTGRPDPVLAAATKEKPFVNSLGMKFVPVKGTDVLFCIHETRWKDYAVYAAAHPRDATNWKSQTQRGFRLTEREGDHPVLNVSWEDAAAFCVWLSKEENKLYRLPTDREWSQAVGLGRKETWRRGDTPGSVSRNQDEFPWGNDWPPPTGAGNYSDQSGKAQAPDPNVEYLARYNDGFPTTAPVMSFAPNQFGLHDMSGNVWEWVEDWWNESKTTRVLRGAGWSNSDRSELVSSRRSPTAPNFRRGDIGFRVIVVVAPDTR